MWVRRAGRLRGGWRAWRWVGRCGFSFLESGGRMMVLLLCGDGLERWVGAIAGVSSLVGLVTYAGTTLLDTGVGKSWLGRRVPHAVCHWYVVPCEVGFTCYFKHFLEVWLLNW